MTEKYLIDTSIWVDLYENRKGFHNEPLGDYALKLLIQIKANGRGRKNCKRAKCAKRRCFACDNG